MIKRMKSFIKKRSIKEQILVSMTLSSMLAAVILGIILFSFSKRTIERNYQSAYEHNLQVSSSIIDIYFRNFIDLSRTLLNDYSFKSTILGESNTNAYFSSTNSRIIERILIDLGEQSRYIQNITVISKNGHILFHSKLNYEGGKMQPYYREGSILDGDWVTVAGNANGREVFFGYNVLFEDKNATFSMVKELRNPDDIETMGYLVFNIKKSIFEKAFANDQVTYLTNRFMIIDKHPATVKPGEMQQLVYVTGNEAEQEQILSDYLGRNHSPYLFSESRNAESGWEIVNVVERGELSRDSSYIGWITVLVCLGMLVVCIVVASKISGAIIRPLLLLEKMIKRVGDGKFLVDAEFDESEVGRIGNRFKSMVNNNLELHERLLQSVIREQEAELLLLQSQINPHFLYNTLDSLYFKAVIEEADDIAEMVLALSDTFKLSLNKGDKLIRVCDEIDKVKAYIKIQNMRYHDRFETIIDVDEEIWQEKMLTFILQPLVENAVYHGLEPKLGGECRITVSGYLADGKMNFTIADNGVGIDDLTKLNSGYGVRNIKARIGLFYGGDGEVLFESRPGEGTKVTVRIPVLRDGQESGESDVSFGDSR